MDADGAGRPRRLIVRPGHRVDAPVAAELVGAFAPRWCLADGACDARVLRTLVSERGGVPMIPNNPTRRTKHPSMRSFIANATSWSEHSPTSRTGGASQHDTTSWQKVYLAAVTIAAIVVFRL